jgi:hypothetical protein
VKGKKLELIELIKPSERFWAGLVFGIIIGMYIGASIVGGGS